jgi:hypothetical protein
VYVRNLERHKTEGGALRPLAGYSLDINWTNKPKINNECTRNLSPIFYVLIARCSNVWHVRLLHYSVATQVSRVFIFVSLKISTSSAVEMTSLNEQSPVLGYYIMIKDPVY